MKGTYSSYLRPEALREDAIAKFQSFISEESGPQLIRKNDRFTHRNTPSFDRRIGNENVDSDGLD